MVVVLVWLMVLVVLVIGYGQNEGQVGLELVSDISGLNVEMVESDKFSRVLEEMGIWQLSRLKKVKKVRWELVDKPQAKAKAVGESGEVVFSMDFVYEWLTKTLVIKMHYGSSYFEKEGDELSYILARDMLAYAHLIKTDNWQKDRFALGLGEALDWVYPRLLGAGGWVKVSRN